MKQSIKIVMPNTIAPRNPIARDLADPRYAQRIVRNRKIYTRLGRNKVRDHE